MLRFREVVLRDVAKYATPFRVYEDERKTILTTSFTSLTATSACAR